MGLTSIRPPYFKSMSSYCRPCNPMTSMYPVSHHPRFVRSFGLRSAITWIVCKSAVKNLSLNPWPSPQRPVCHGGNLLHFFFIKNLTENHINPSVDVTRKHREFCDYWIEPGILHHQKYFWIDLWFGGGIVISLLGWVDFCQSNLFLIESIWVQRWSMNTQTLSEMWIIRDQCSIHIHIYIYTIYMVIYKLFKLYMCILLSFFS